MVKMSPVLGSLLQQQNNSCKGSLGGAQVSPSHTCEFNISLSGSQSPRPVRNAYPCNASLCPVAQMGLAIHVKCSMSVAVMFVATKKTK